MSIYLLRTKNLFFVGFWSNWMMCFYVSLRVPKQFPEQNPVKNTVNTYS